MVEKKFFEKKNFSVTEFKSNQLRPSSEKNQLESFENGKN